MKKKSVRPSTTRSTAGPGFDFEDQVAAWLLLKVLNGQPLPGVDGIGTHVPVSFFFDDMPPEVAQTGGRRPFGFSESEAAVYEADTLAKRETLELVRAYYRIKNEKVRKRVFELAKALAKADEKR